MPSFGSVWKLVSALCVALCLAAPASGAVKLPDASFVAAVRRTVNEARSFDNRYIAQVWLMDMSTRLARRIPEPDRRLTLLRQVHHEATRAGLKPELVLAVIDVESNFNRYAISEAGAEGLMQVMPFWLDEIGHPEDNLFHVTTNLRIGCAILKHYLQVEHGDVTRALARYNGSTGSNHYPLKVYEALRRRWFPQ